MLPLCGCERWKLRCRLSDSSVVRCLSLEWDAHTGATSASSSGGTGARSTGSFSIGDRVPAATAASSVAQADRKQHGEALPAKTLQKSTQQASKKIEKGIQNMTQVGLEFKPLLGRFSLDFGPKLGNKLEPNWHQNLETWGPKTLSKKSLKIWRRNVPQVVRDGPGSWPLKTPPGSEY